VVIVPLCGFTDDC